MLGLREPYPSTGKRQFHIRLLCLGTARPLFLGTHEDVCGGAAGSAAALNESTRSFLNPGEGGPAHDVGVGVAVGDQSFSPGVLLGRHEAVQLRAGQVTHDILTAALFSVVNMVLKHSLREHRPTPSVPGNKVHSTSGRIF